MGNFRPSRIIFILSLALSLNHPGDLLAETLGFWRFDNNLLDSSGQEFHGVPEPGRESKPIHYRSLGHDTGLKCGATSPIVSGEDTVKVFVADHPSWARTSSLTIEGEIILDQGQAYGNLNPIVWRGDEATLNYYFGLIRETRQLLIIWLLQLPPTRCG